MVAESDKHAAELLKMIGVEPIAATSRGSVGTSKGKVEAQPGKESYQADNLKQKNKPKKRGKERR